MRLVIVQAFRAVVRGGTGALWFSALGLACALATSALASEVLHSLLNRMPPGVSEPEAVARILFETVSTNRPSSQTTMAAFNDLRSALGNDAAVAARRREQLLFGDGLNAIEVAGEFVSP